MALSKRSATAGEITAETASTKDNTPKSAGEYNLDNTGNARSVIICEKIDAPDSVRNPRNCRFLIKRRTWRQRFTYEVADSNWQRA
ncbi:hypothetical protein GCM10010038_33400 [Glutamicibacter protophormiae]|nr:hypothetical protein GCM10010038_33400 [Glutamicibacter protophormiae]